ncbi:MAG: hypothetical protein V1790_17550 [Planctomycetota bacterium]
MTRFEQTITGGSQNTGRGVVRIGAGATEANRVHLTLPENWTADPEGLKILNDRLRQIEYEVGRPKEYEVSVPVHYAYANWTPPATGFSVTAANTPVTGAKLSLDKIGTWLLLMEVDWMSLAPGNRLSASLVVDPATEAEAKMQAATTNSTAEALTEHSDTAWGLFTATSIPRLVQLYAKEVGWGGPGSNTVIYPPTHIAAIWLSAWTTSTRRFGRQTPSLTASILDPYGVALTIYGEEARWPKSEHPDTLPIGADFLSL